VFSQFGDFLTGGQELPSFDVLGQLQDIVDNSVPMVDDIVGSINGHVDTVGAHLNGVLDLVNDTALDAHETIKGHINGHVEAMPSISEIGDHIGNLHNTHI